MPLQNSKAKASEGVVGTSGEESLPDPQVHISVCTLLLLMHLRSVRKEQTSIIVGVAEQMSV